MDTVQWERGIGEPEVARDKGRRIEITPAMRAADERQQRARAAAQKPVWMRPVTVRAAPVKPTDETPMERSFKVVTMRNRPKKGRRSENSYKFVSCDGCGVRLATMEMEKHRKVCVHL